MMQWIKKLFGLIPPERITKQQIEQLPPVELCRKFIDGELECDTESAIFHDVMCAVELHVEVFNGGFNQYYYNSDGERSECAESMFVRLGAIQAADVVKRANDLYGMLRDELHSMWDTGTKQGFLDSYKKKFFDTLDREYFALMKSDEQLYELIGTFIKGHPEDFLTEK